MMMALLYVKRSCVYAGRENGQNGMRSFLWRHQIGLIDVALIAGCDEGGRERKRKREYGDITLDSGHLPRDVFLYLFLRMF